ncbi:MAG: chromosome segregation SMC family protein [Candidatus ainarchaeum sp.]|nr:chromosome segregation SMC family protein [Candidatus ainarchaeum sp.]
MQLKELIIKNFKSFDYTKIPFKKGLHIVVGPNGSGKSNIVDALLFVFGSTSLKRLRVDKLTNLINHNTKANTAKVRAVMIDDLGNEIEISREIDKEGKSIFSLNDKKKALHEITSYLNDLGIDTDGYNTVQQGDVIKIINLKPEERRGIIDDVSGISLFDARKKEAETNLKKVSEKLSKVSIALNERKPYVEQLKEEKENALRFKELDLLEKKYNYNLYSKQIAFLEKENDEYSIDLEEKQEKSNNLITEKQEVIKTQKDLEAKLEGINQELINHSEKVQSTYGSKLSEVSANKEIYVNNININTDNLNYLKQENIRSTSVLNESKKELENLEVILKNISSKVVDKSQIRDSIKSKLLESQKEYDKVKSLQEELYEKLSEYNKDINSKQDKYFEVKSRINSYNLQKETLENKDKEQEVLKKNLDTKKVTLEKDISSLEKDISSLEKEFEKVKYDISSLKEEKEELSEKYNLKRIDLSSLKKNLSSSINLEKKRDELSLQLKDFNTFNGFLDEIISLNESERSYFSSYVVLENDSEISKIIKKIDYNLSFVVLSVLGIKKGDLSSYFKNLHTSKTKAKTSIKDFYFDGFSFKKISFKDSKKLEQEISSIEKDIEKISINLNKIEERNNLLDEKYSEIDNSLRSKKISYNTQKEILKDVLEKSSDISLNKNIKLSKDITLNLGQLSKELETLEKELTSQKTLKEELEEKLKSINLSNHDSLRDEYDDIVSEINTLEQSLISKSSDKKILLEKIESKDKYILSNLDKIKSLEQKINDLNDKKQEIDNEVIKINELIRKEDEKKGNLVTQKQDISIKINELSQKERSFDSLVSEINLSINNIRIMMSTNDNKITQFRQNLEFLDIKQSEKEDLDLSLEEINTEIRRLRREKNSLGNINFNAISSYDKLAKEFDEISEKAEILEKEKEQVISMLSEINMKKKTVFMDCFEKISKEFKNNIKKMSKLLSGSLTLEGNDILTSKLMINLTKNGKTKDIDIMSGGEKTITALAFIFSLHTYKKSPFYILDEVDAALDDYNALSLLSFIKELSKDTTILSVSHNGTVVSGADQIIGVTLKDNTTVIGLNLK